MIHLPYIGVVLDGVPSAPGRLVDWGTITLSGDASNHGAPSCSIASSTSPIADTSRSSAPSLPVVSTFSCHHCAAEFERCCDLKYVHDIMNLEKCYNANGYCSKHTLRNHQKRFKCLHSGCSQKLFGVEADLKRHILAKHSVSGEKACLKCSFPGCNKVFSRKDNMRRHVGKKHM